MLGFCAQSFSLPLTGRYSDPMLNSAALVSRMAREGQPWRLSSRGWPLEASGRLRT